jgi:C-terminal processing protease CtpA/Prc
MPVGTLPRIWYLSSLFALCSVVHGAAAASGWFGLKLKVDADGFLNPVVRSITIEMVVPGSPAAKAGLAAGDAVIEVQGVKVGGTKASELKPVLQTSVGENLRLKVAHGSAPPKEVVLKAAPKPSG